MEARRAKSLIQLKPMSDVVAAVNAEGKKTEEFLDFLNRAVNCPDRFAHAFADDMDPKLKAWAKTCDGSKGLFIYGSVGTGKTFGIYALAKLFRANRVKAVVKNVPDWLDHLRSHYDNSRSEQEIKDELREEAVMFLDDIGSEKQTDWTNEIMYRLVNNRYEQIRPTIFSSNLDLEEIGKRYGDRIASRIVEMVGGDAGIIKIDGADRRLK